MHFIHQDFRKGIVTLRVTDGDDLWYLSQLIEPGDLLRGTASRKLKIGEGENAKTTKKTFTVTIQAETIQFSSSGTSLRINGKIKDGPEDIPRESYQAIELELGNDCSIEKKQWFSYQRQKLREAGEKRYIYILCLMDREEALFALTKKSGFEILLRLKGDVPKKGKFVDVKKDFHQELLQLFSSYAERYHPEAIIIASPAFYKDDFAQKLPDDLRQKVVLAVCSDVDEANLQEVMKRPELEKTLLQSRLRHETMMVEEFLRELHNDGAAAYGWEEVRSAMHNGAVAKLLLTDQCIRRHREQGSYAHLDELMKQVDAQHGEIALLSSEHEAGKQIDGLGGIAALLRYKIRPSPV